MAVGGIDEMFDHTARKAPLHRNIDGNEVGKTAVYLLSDLSSGVTGETSTSTAASTPSAFDAKPVIFSPIPTRLPLAELHLVQVHAS